MRKELNKQRRNERKNEFWRKLNENENGNEMKAIKKKGTKQGRETRNLRKVKKNWWCKEIKTSMINDKKAYKKRIHQDKGLKL